MLVRDQQFVERPRVVPGKPTIALQEFQVQGPLGGNGLINDGSSPLVTIRTFDQDPNTFMPINPIRERCSFFVSGAEISRPGRQEYPCTNAPPSRVGFFDGFGTGFEVAGSGTPGALLGLDCLANPQTAPARG